jgi:hypothetical protein
VVQAGADIVQVLAGDSKTQLDAWINTYKLNTTTVRDPDAMPTQTLTALVRREYCYLVELSTMKIVRVWVGSTNGTGTTSAKCAMDCAVATLNKQVCAQTCP